MKDKGWKNVLRCGEIQENCDPASKPVLQENRDVDDKYDKGLTSRSGCSGKREQVCPSGPIPSSNRSNTGKLSSGKTCVFKTILLSLCKTFINMSI